MAAMSEVVMQKEDHGANLCGTNRVESHGRPWQCATVLRCTKRMLQNHRRMSTRAWFCVDPSRVSCLCRALCGRCLIPFGNDAQAALDLTWAARKESRQK